MFHISSRVVSRALRSEVAPSLCFTLWISIHLTYFCTVGRSACLDLNGVRNIVPKYCSDYERSANFWPVAVPFPVPNCGPWQSRMPPQYPPSNARAEISIFCPWCWLLQSERSPLWFRYECDCHSESTCRPWSVSVPSKKWMVPCRLWPAT